MLIRWRGKQTSSQGPYTTSRPKNIDVKLQMLVFTFLNLNYYAAAPTPTFFSTPLAKNKIEYVTYRVR